MSLAKSVFFSVPVAVLLEIVGLSVWGPELSRLDPSSPEPLPPVAERRPRFLLLPKKDLDATSFLPRQTIGR